MTARTVLGIAITQVAADTAASSSNGPLRR
jgi:hypothetical protein